MGWGGDANGQRTKLQVRHAVGIPLQESVWADALGASTPPELCCE